jgi:hypothetical protein
MAITTIGVQGLESYQPAVDYRRSGRVGVLSGRNFAWDASGVYSAYASRLVAGSSSIGAVPTILQTLDLEDAVHVAATDKIWRMIPSSVGSPVGTWELVKDCATLVHSDENDVPYNYRKWTAAYLGAKPYACSYNHGVFEVDLTANPPTYTRLTSGTVAGFPSDATPVIAICETNGRMLYVTSSTVYWSAPNAPKNLTPALGGAGFQVIAERIGGKVVGVTSVSQGAIIWTTAGALVAEFIGGDTVFRWWVLSTQALPISSFAIARMPDDDYIILTRLGLFMFNNLSQPQPITPLFNEFLREYLRSKPTELGHVWYSITDNRIYAAMRESTSAFVETFALDIMLDRWGIFSEPHMGIFDYGVSRGQLAYATPQGIASFLLSPRDERKNRENPLAPGTFIGLGSDILIGWLRAENLIPHADTVQELHEILVNRLVPFGEVQTIYVDEGIITDGSPTIVDEGLITDGGPTLYDEGLISDQDEVFNYRLQVYTDLFTDEVDGEGVQYIFEPELARQNRRSDLWTIAAPAMYFRLRFIANDPDEFFRANSMDLTVAYDGNIS